MFSLMIFGVVSFKRHSGYCCEQLYINLEVHIHLDTLLWYMRLYFDIWDSTLIYETLIHCFYILVLIRGRGGRLRLCYAEHDKEEESKHHTSLFYKRCISPKWVINLSNVKNWKHFVHAQIHFWLDLIHIFKRYLSAVENSVCLVSILLFLARLHTQHRPMYW